MRILNVLGSAGLLGLSACGLITEARSPLRASVAVDQTVVSAGTPVTVTAVLHNDGPDTVMAWNPQNYGCVASFIVTDSSGQVVGPMPRVCSLVFYAEVKLAPHDSIVARDAWSPTTVGPADGPVALPAGPYFISARMSGDNRELRSAPVQVRITGR